MRLGGLAGPALRSWGGGVSGGVGSRFSAKAPPVPRGTRMAWESRGLVGCSGRDAVVRGPTSKAAVTRSARFHVERRHAGGFADQWVGGGVFAPSLAVGPHVGEPWGAASAPRRVVPSRHEALRRVRPVMGEVGRPAAPTPPPAGWSRSYGGDVPFRHDAPPRVPGDAR